MERELTDHYEEIPQVNCSTIALDDVYRPFPGIIGPVNQKRGKVTFKKSKVSHNLYDELYLNVGKRIFMPIWQLKIKRLFDVLFVIVATLLVFPLILFILTGIKISSKGPIIYSQDRVGQFGRRFRIYKFRSMVNGAEPSGPMLSSIDDKRITLFGHFIRKTHLDELPQFYNILRGDMSLVGPRPERLFYIDQIIEHAPQYLQLLNVKPGLTSWGQVKYGYAKNVDEMLVRLKYDMKYIENMSLLVDINILICTIKTLIKFNGI